MSSSKISKLEFDVGLAHGTLQLLLYPLVEAKSVEFVHADDLGHFLPVLYQLVANGADLVGIGCKLRDESVLVGLVVLLVKQIQVGISQDKVEVEIQHRVLNRG